MEGFQKTYNALKQYGEEYAEELKEGLIRDDYVATKSLLKSIVSRIEEKDGRISMYVEANRYIGITEDGANPPKKGKGKKRDKRLKDWIDARGITFDESRIKNKYQRRYFSKLSKDKKEKALLYVIKKGINQKGTSKRYNYGGSRLLSITNKKMEKSGLEDVFRVFEKELEIMIQKNLQNE